MSAENENAQSKSSKTSLTSINSKFSTISLTLYRKSLRTLTDETFYDKSYPHVFVVLGASGCLATRKIYPTLWTLFRDELLPENVKFYGYARSKLSVEDLKLRTAQYMIVKEDETEKFIEFWKLHSYITGSYDSLTDFQRLNIVLSDFKKEHNSNRMFYVALPDFLFEDVTLHIRKTCMGQRGWTRLILEKPFGRDMESSNKLSNHLMSFFKEEQIYRMDHYLGKEMVQSLMALRFGNRIFNPTWNRENIASVKITFKEPYGVQGRGAYFDQYGIIRDVILWHLLQILASVAMEKPVSCDPKDIRAEKAKVLKCIKSVQLKDVVIGQYVGNTGGPGGAKVGYHDEPSVPKHSLIPTYACVVIYINNERWDGVPFILKCGKALDEKKSEVWLQFNDVAGDIFGNKLTRNEFVIKVQPDEALSLKIMVKSPGIGFDMEETILDLSYSQQYTHIKLPDAYERLLLDVFCGNQENFMSTEELNETWRIFDPVLQKIEQDRIKPLPYKFGSRGPQEADKLMKNSNFLREESTLFYLNS